MKTTTCSPMFGRRWAWRSYLCRVAPRCDGGNVFGWRMPALDCRTR